MKIGDFEIGITSTQVLVAVFVILLGGDEAREVIIGPDDSTPAEYPWELVRACTPEQSYALYNKRTGYVYRDYYVRDDDERVLRSGFRYVPIEGTPDATTE